MGNFKNQPRGKTHKAASGPFENAGAPTNGVNGTLAGIAGIGALLIDTTNAVLYQNVNTQASPTWQKIGGLAVLDGSDVATVANANVIGGIPTLFRIDVPDGTGNTDVVVTNKIRVLDAWGMNTGIAAHATADTWQVKNGATAISDAVAKTATVNAVKRISTLDPAQVEIAAGGTLRIAAVHNTNSAVTVYVLAVRVA